MGIQNRDYMQDEPVRGFGRRGGSVEMVKTLIIINVVVYVVQLMMGPSFSNWFDLSPRQVMGGQIWRLITFDFLHDTEGSMPWHLLFNMWLLYLLGRRVESLLGGREFLAFYLVSGVASAIGFVLWSLVTKSPNPAVGASGSVIAVMIVFALNWPQERLYIWGIFPLPVIWLAAIAAIFDILPMLQELGGRGQGDGIAHAAHLGGIVFGFLYVRNRWELTGLLNRSGKPMRNPFRRRPKLRVLHPEMDDSPTRATTAEIEARVDQLLQKISEQGESSLTTEERNFLSDASRRYRHRP